MSDCFGPLFVVAFGRWRAAMIVGRSELDAQWTSCVAVALPGRGQRRLAMVHPREPCLSTPWRSFSSLQHPGAWPAATPRLPAFPRPFSALNCDHVAASQRSQIWMLLLVGKIGPPRCRPAWSAPRGNSRFRVWVRAYRAPSRNSPVAWTNPSCLRACWVSTAVQVGHN